MAQCNVELFSEINWLINEWNNAWIDFTGWLVQRMSCDHRMSTPATSNTNNKCYKVVDRHLRGHVSLALAQRTPRSTLIFRSYPFIQPWLHLTIATSLSTLRSQGGDFIKRGFPTFTSNIHQRVQTPFLLHLYFRPVRFKLYLQINLCKGLS